MTQNNKKSQSADALNSLVGGNGAPSPRQAPRPIPKPPIPSAAAKVVRPPAVPPVPKVSMARPVPVPVPDPVMEMEEDDQFQSPADFPDQSAGDGDTDFQSNSAAYDPMAALSGGGAPAPRTSMRSKVGGKGKSQLVHAEGAKRTMIPMLYAVGVMLLIMSVVVAVYLGTWNEEEWGESQPPPMMIRFGPYMLAGTIPVALITLGGAIFLSYEIRRAYRANAAKANRGRGR